MTKHKKRSADVQCQEINCYFEEECAFSEKEIRNARRRAKRHSLKTGHKVLFIIETIWTYK